MMPKSKTHEITVKVRFNAPVTRTVAKSALRDNLDHNLYASLYEEEKDGWHDGKVTAVK